MAFLEGLLMQWPAIMFLGWLDEVMGYLIASLAARSGLLGVTGMPNPDPTPLLLK